MAKRLSGKEVAQAMQKELARRAEELKRNDIRPTLAIIRVGEKESDIAYERGAMKKMASLGISVRNLYFDQNVAETTLITAIKDLNEDANVHGVLLFRPLPEHLDAEKICNTLIAEKDVDAMTTINSGLVYDGSSDGFPPCTAQAVMEILDYYNIEVKSARVALVGWGAVVGKPLSVLLLTRFATVTVCHIFTKDVSTPCKNAEIVISAAGKAGLVGEQHLAPGQIVIDVGINADPNDPAKIVGDVDFAYADGVVDAITPVPGGVGSVTTSVLAKHVIIAAEKQAARKG
ncbi:MAG: bifunctional 5,10-methylenetetrahydrofolate dehydrogenase/5,10-methenyltetrahydrofolate cyclohydrolase [Bacillota bacterium]|jgi:methylenetetrahydrofolate dehydrogenase (NADP+)/methenyltetrahydrofolate cyclohydrolase